ncbi:MAG: MEDS domain-containing protein [Armatimonadota bacterium]
MRVGDTVRAAVTLPGVLAGTVGVVQEIGRLFVVVSFPDGRQRHYARQQLVSGSSTDESGDGNGQQGIPALGIAGARLPRGSHCCLLSPCQGALVRTAASFAAAGLREGETVLCAIPPTWRSVFLSALGLAGRNNGNDGAQLMLVSPSRLYLPCAEFSAERQLDRTGRMLAGAAKGNPRGARAVAFVGNRPGLSGWWEYEERITPRLADSGVTALCVYQCTRPGTEPWEQAVAIHPYAVCDGQLAPAESR